MPTSQAKISSLSAEFGYATDKGKVRSNNEDSVVVSDELNLAAVADGMGGHNSGELASNMAARTLVEKIAAIHAGKLSAPVTDTRLSRQANDLIFAATAANAKIFETSKIPDNKGMGTTLSAVLFHPTGAAIAHIGDSRIYVLRKGKLVQITQDHSLVMEQVRKGIITKEEAEASTMQNILTRAMGIHKNIRFDVGDVTLSPGDRLLLCTDGLFKAVKEELLPSILSSSDSPQKIAAGLVRLANDNGGPDNISVVVVTVGKSTVFSRLKKAIRKARRVLSGETDGETRQG